MKKGDIIRKTLNSGLAVGPYMVVTRATNDRIDASPIITGDVITLKKENVVKITTIRLRIPKLDLHNIVEKDLYVYSHKPSQKWVEASDLGDVEVVALTSQDGEYAYFSNCSFKYVKTVHPYTGNVTNICIRMTIGNLIYHNYGRKSTFWV